MKICSVNDLVNQSFNVVFINALQQFWLTTKSFQCFGTPKKQNLFLCLNGCKITYTDKNGSAVTAESGDVVYTPIGSEYKAQLFDFQNASSHTVGINFFIYDEDGNYIGFVMAIMLMQNIHKETWQTAFVFMLITIAAILMELLISTELSSTIKKSLMGYEPDVFSAMYRIRDNILESLDEGIIAIDNKGNVQFVNGAAEGMLNQIESGLATRIVGENINNLQLGSETLLIDRMPIKEKEICVGEIAILHDRAEYTKLMEDLTGTRYLVDSMRANNHDFTNKLHVILGLIQMEMYDKAVSYIENITIVQRSTISKIMNVIQEPAVAALLIGKTARASELNVKFVLREGCFYSNADMQLPSELLVTIIGNLIENAFEAMNDTMDYDVQKELIFGIYSRPGAVLITTDDTGVGISEENLQRIFDNGFSTKGEGRGTGLYQVKEMVERYGGVISVETQEGVGSSFSVSFTK